MRWVDEHAQVFVNLLGERGLTMPLQANRVLVIDQGLAQEYVPKEWDRLVCSPSGVEQAMTRCARPCPEPGASGKSSVFTATAVKYQATRATPAFHG
jgi:hypothetical protein